MAPGRPEPPAAWNAYTSRLSPNYAPRRGVRRPVRSPYTGTRPHSGAYRPPRFWFAAVPFIQYITVFEQKRGTTIELSEGIRILTEEKRIITGINLSFGNARSCEQHCTGLIQECERMEDGSFIPCERKSEPESVYDLASVTKIFTAVSILQLKEAGRISFDDPISKHDRRFRNLNDITVLDLLSFQKAVSTDDRIDTQESSADALAQLFSAKPSPRPERRYYTDMGAMILKYVIESASGTDYYSYLKDHILSPLGMSHTYAVVPPALYPKTACYNYERRILADGRKVLDTDCPVGTVHDPKARIISRDGSDLCGHAGLFSTIGDMTLLAQGLLNGCILPRTLLMEMGKNRTGYRLPDGTYTHYLGYLCYAKHPVQTYSEVPQCFTDGTTALNGFTGNHFSVDPNRNMFMIHLSNRIHNRVTVATGRPDPDNHLESVMWDDGMEYPVSQNYVYYKDKHLKNPIGEILDRKYRT